MRKYDLADVCNYMKKLIIPQMPDDFKIAEKFRHGLTDDEILKGISAFREFLYELFDKLSADKDMLDVQTRDNYNPYIKQDKTNVRMCFPTIPDLSMILISLGIRGNLEMKEKRLIICVEDLLTVICDKTEKYVSLINMSGERKLEMFNILSDLGLCFNGVDFSKEVDFTKIKQFDVTYSKNDFFIVGLKLLAEATLNHKDYYYIMNIFTVLLQCDFYPLANIKPKKHVQHINIFANTQPPEIKEWIKNIDELLISNDCTMVRSDGAFQYIKRGKSVTYGMVCNIFIDITGCFIIPGVNHLEHRNSIIDNLPDDMLKILKDSAMRQGEFNLEQCYRKTGNMGFASYTFTHNNEEFEGCRHAGLRCQFSGVKCRFTGYKFDLSDTKVRELMKKWIKMEAVNYF